MRRAVDFLRRIRVRLTLWYVLLLAIALIFFCGVLYFSLKSSLLNEVNTTLRNTAGQLASSMDWEDNQLTVQETEGSPSLMIRMAAQGFAIRVSDTGGNSLQTAGPYSDVLGDRGVRREGFATVKAGDKRWCVYSTRASIGAGKPNVFIQVGESLAKAESTLASLVLLEAAIVPVMLLLAIALGYFLSSRALRPIDKVTRLAGSIEAVDLGKRLGLDLPPDEVGRLARTFDEMLERLEEAFISQKRLVSEAAHELRTPLTVMKGSAEVALGRERTAAEYREVLEELKAETDHLVDLAEDLLTLSQPESDRAVLDVQELDLAEVAGSAVNLMSPMARQKSIRIKLEGTGPIPFRGDSNKLTRMFVNLLDNVVRYSPAHAVVSVTLACTENEITAEVRDTGPGIESDELDHIFDRFHRLEEARETNPSGSGLGLPIARWIATAHAGDIKVESGPGIGTTFRITFPRQRFRD
jgi:heavy metal sensor kinase